MGDEGPTQFADSRTLKERMPRVMLWGGERFRTYEEAEPWIREGVYDAVQSDCIHMGLTQNWRVAQRARAAGVKMVPHNWSTSLGTMCNAHLVAATGGHMCEFFMYPSDFRYGLFKEPYRPHQSRITIGDEPGFGMVSLDHGWHLGRGVFRSHGPSHSPCTTEPSSCFRRARRNPTVSYTHARQAARRHRLQRVAQAARAVRALSAAAR